MVKLIVFILFSAFWLSAIALNYGYAGSDTGNLGSKRFNLFLVGPDINKNRLVEAESTVNSPDSQAALARQWLINNPLDPQSWLYLARSDVSLSKAQSEVALAHAAALSQNRTVILNEIYFDYLISGDTGLAVDTAVMIVKNRPDLFDQFFFDLYPLLSSDTLINTFILKAHQKRMSDFLENDERRYSLLLKAIDQSLRYKDSGLSGRLIHKLPIRYATQKSLIGDYLRLVSREQSPNKLMSIWRKFADYDPTINKVSDPTFEHFPDPVEACWSYQPSPDVTVSSDKKSGLRIEFKGNENISFYHVKCLVSVEPNTRYQLKWRWFGQDLSTRSGIFIEVTAPGVNKLAESQDRIGNWPWQSEEIGFTTSGETHFINITLRRKPTSNLDNKISGSVIFNNFELTK